MQEPVKPGPVHVNVLPVLLASPAIAAEPVQRWPPPICGPENVNVPLNCVFVTVPETCPFQSDPFVEVHVPLIESPACDNAIVTGAVAQLEDSSVPLQLPPICAKFEGEFGLSQLATNTSAHTSTRRDTTGLLLGKSFSDGVDE